MNLYKENHDENRKQTALLHEIHDVLKKEKVNYEVRETPLGEKVNYEVRETPLSEDD